MSYEFPMFNNTIILSSRKFISDDLRYEEEFEDFSVIIEHNYGVIILGTFGSQIITSRTSGGYCYARHDPENKTHNPEHRGNISVKYSAIHIDDIKDENIGQNNSHPGHPMDMCSKCYQEIKKTVEDKLESEHQNIAADLL